ncbi:MAG TPA: hypothetical protein VGV38_21270 [Pyrinomonadaceae bacterium]|nr:hypothetical protein [Pyrinomonadaceae bacterium]
MRHARTHTLTHAQRGLALCASLLLALTNAFAQATPPAAPADSSPAQDGIALAPARFELEMTPGSETTVVVNLDYHTARKDARPSRILASLNDWALSPSGELEFFRAGTRPRSACPWMVYSPAEVVVEPGKTHSVRVTISVPADAAPGDHLAALVVEQRPDAIKLNRNARQMVLRYRMAALFYVKVPGLTREGSLADLKAVAEEEGVRVTPTLRNEGNSVVRPVTSLTVKDSTGRVLAHLPEGESLPVLGHATLSQPIRLRQTLPPGKYSVTYRVDFQGHGKTTEGITDLVIHSKDTQPLTAANAKPTPAP